MQLFLASSCGNNLLFLREKKKKADFLFCFISIPFSIDLIFFPDFRTSLSEVSPTSPQSSLSNRSQKPALGNFIWTSGEVFHS